MLGERYWARAIGATKLNDTVIEDAVVRKTRRLGAGVTIAGGNAFFALAGAPFRMFTSTGAWAAREREAFGVLHGAEVAVSGRTLVFPRLPGVDLATVLRDGGLDDRALVAAGRCLREAHGREGFTHGDAHLGNYLYDSAEGVCRLIDFDAEHVASLPLYARQADDAAVFILDMLGRTGRDDAGRRAALFLDAYGPDAEVSRAIAEALTVPGGLAGVLTLSRAHGASRDALSRGFDAVRAVAGMTV